MPQQKKTNKKKQCPVFRRYYCVLQCVHSILFDEQSLWLRISALKGRSSTAGRGNRGAQRTGHLPGGQCTSLTVGLEGWPVAWTTGPAGSTRAKGKRTRTIERHLPRALEMVPAIKRVTSVGASPRCGLWTRSLVFYGPLRRSPHCPRGERPQNNRLRSLELPRGPNGTVRMGIRKADGKGQFLPRGRSCPDGPEPDQGPEVDAGPHRAWVWV